MNNVIGVVTFQDKEAAGKFLSTLQEWEKQNFLEIEDAVVVVKDDEGNVSVQETKHATTKKGAVRGGTAGFIIGAILGGPVGGILLGAAAGAVTAKKLDLGIPNEKIEVVSESMNTASSALFAHLTKITKPDMLSAARRQFGGEVVELELTEEEIVNVDRVMLSIAETHE